MAVMLFRIANTLTAILSKNISFVDSIEVPISYNRRLALQYWVPVENARTMYITDNTKPSDFIPRTNHETSNASVHFLGVLIENLDPLLLSEKFSLDSSRRMGFRNLHLDCTVLCTLDYTAVLLLVNTAHFCVTNAT